MALGLCELIKSIFCFFIKPKDSLDSDCKLKDAQAHENGIVLQSVSGSTSADAYAMDSDLVLIVQENKGAISMSAASTTHDKFRPTPNSGTLDSTAVDRRKWVDGVKGQVCIVDIL